MRGAWLALAVLVACSGGKDKDAKAGNGDDDDAPEDGMLQIAEEDMVGLYQFLASDASSYITGQAIAADAGMTAGLSYGLLRGVGAPI